MDIVEKFINLHLDYIEVVLEPSVSRACSADDRFSKNIDLQKKLQQTTLGLCVIYHMAFVQAALEEKWSTLKRPNSPQRDDFNIDWDKFDTFKYIRDCFAHNPDGEMFSDQQSNTIKFQSNMIRYPELKLEIIDNQLKITPSTVLKSFNYFEELLRETIT